MYTCPHTAVALAVLEKLVARGVIPKNERGLRLHRQRLKFTEFKVGYHEGAIPAVSSTMANPRDAPAAIRRRDGRDFKRFS